MSSSRILILNADFDMSMDKFLNVMWSDNAFWHKVQREQGLFNLEFVEKNDHRVATKSKVKMIKNETLAKLIPFIPADCDQETETSITRDSSGNITAEDYINSFNFPYAEAITIVRTYNVTKTATGINVKVEADLRWKQTVVDAIKPSIQADVHRSMESFGKSLHAGLLAC